MSRDAVGVCRVGGSVRDAVREAMELADWRAYIPAGARVALKPNLCWDLPLPGAQTSPWFLAAVIEVLEPRVSDIVVVEAGQVTVDADRALRRCGLDRVLARYGIPFVNMSRGDFSRVVTSDAATLRHVDVPSVLHDRVLVTLPVLKTHSTTTVSGALKNQWGCLPEMRHNHHLVVDQAIADLNEVLRPALAVMDGTVGLEGNGPKTGHPRVCDLVLASADPVALDATAARLMGFDPGEVPHLVAASERGLGTLDARVLGLEVADMLHFRSPRPGIVQRVEFGLRRSRLRRLAFDTPLFGGFALAAQMRNALWYAAVGARARRRVIREYRFGMQWLGEDEPPSEDRT